jgi:hypothetical protein
MTTDEDWRRAVEAVEARMSELRMGRAALAREAGVDRKTIDNFLDRGAKPRTEKRGGYEVALGWRHGSLLTIARGGEATVTEENPQPPDEERGSSVGAGAEHADELVFRLRVPPGATPRQRDMARRAAEASARAVLEELDRDEE